MRTVFIHGEVEQYSEVKAALVERFTAWSGADGTDETPALVVGFLLDDKFVRDGLLARWSGHDLERFLTEEVPRRLALDSGWSTVPEVLHRWLRFLVAEELLMPGDDSPEALHAAVDRNTVPYMEAMADPARWGSAKFWSVTMLEHGVDTGDESAVENFFAAVDRGEVDVDDEIVELVEGREGLEPAPHPAHWLPPVPDSEGDRRDSEAAGTEVLVRVRALLDWVGRGRPLDARGAPADSDVAELAEALGTGGDHFTAMLLLEWAQHVSLVRPVGEQLVPTRISAPLLEQPGVLWNRLWRDFAGLDEFFGERFEELDDLAEGADVFLDLVQHGLRLLHSEDAALPVELLTAVTVSTLVESEAQEVSAAEWEAIRSMLLRILEQWESMGVVRTFGADSEQVETIDAAAPEGTSPVYTVVELLPLGREATRDSLRAMGFVVPTVDEVVECPAEVMVLVWPECPARSGDQLLARWVETRGAAGASAELASLLRRVDDPMVRLTALSVLEHTGPEGVEAVSELCEDPVAGPAARMWLQDRDVEVKVAVRAGDELAFALDSMSVAVDEDAEAFLAELQETPTTNQIALVEEITRARHSRRDSVLEVVATGHPDKRVASVARRSLDR